MAAPFELCHPSGHRCPSGRTLHSSSPNALKYLPSPSRAIWGGLNLTPIGPLIHPTLPLVPTTVPASFVHLMHIRRSMQDKTRPDIQTPSPSIEMADAIQPRARRPISLWRNHDFLLLWGGQVVSATGSQVSLLAFPWLILAISGSPAQAGLIAAIRSIPYILFGLPAGALVDRWNRKRVMILCDTGRALALGSIPIAFALGHLTTLQLYIVSFI